MKGREQGLAVKHFAQGNGEDQRKHSLETPYKFLFGDAAAKEHTRKTCKARGGCCG
jgi:hypothetical protein